MDPADSSRSNIIEPTNDALTIANSLGWLLGYLVAGSEGRELLHDARAAALGSDTLRTDAALLLSSAIEGALAATKVPA